MPASGQVDALQGLPVEIFKHIFEPLASGQYMTDA